jgi:hypothetical protein
MITLNPEQKRPYMNWISYILRSRQFFLTLWFLAYFIWVQPIILARLAQAPEQKNIALGLILIVIQILELIGIWLKFPATVARIEANRSQSTAQVLIIFLVLTHIFITALLAFATIKLFGIEVNNNGLLNGLIALIIFFSALIKEGLFLIGWFQLLGAKNYRFPPIPRSITPNLAEIIGDGLLAIFSALAYTATWEQIASDTFILGTSFSELALEYFGAIILFMMIFPATRSLYYTEELLTQQPRVARVASWTFLLITMVAALSAIPR